jgi:hypothetical protein
MTSGRWFADAGLAMARNDSIAAVAARIDATARLSLTISLPLAKIPL